MSSGEVQVALLRGINVGTAKRVSMADLRAVFRQLGWSDARTVLQSGNVVFTAPDDPGSGARIRAAIAAATGVDARVLVVSGRRLVAALGANPLLAAVSDPSRCLVTFLDGAVPPGLEVPDPADLAPEQLAVGDGVIYQWCPDGILGSRVPAAFWRPLDAQGRTARNWRTLQRLAALVG